ncbi:MAG: hypothetical protein JXK93_11125 [Sphaerochaetaceae bacterium]|nr:hypothetical protein [Sphaerochaetaceae bacterium]
MKRYHPMRPVIVLLSIVCILVLLFYAALFFAQKYLTSFVNEEFEELSFTSMDISLFKGEVRIEDLQFVNEQVTVYAGAATLMVKPAEIFDMVIGAKELSAFTVHAEEVTAIQEDLTLHLTLLDVEVTGRFLLENFESSVITHVAVQIKEGLTVTEENLLKVLVGELRAEVFGEYRDFASLDSVQELLEATQEFYLDAQTPEIVLSETVREELSVKVPLSSWLTDEESFVGENLSLSLKFTDDTVEIQDVSLSFSILEAEGSAVLSPSRPMQMRIDLTVSSLSDAIRKELNTILMMFFQHIPEGAFQFTLDTRDPVSPPLIRFSPM